MSFFRASTRSFFRTGRAFRSYSKEAPGPEPLKEKEPWNATPWLVVGVTTAAIYAYMSFGRPTQKERITALLTPMTPDAFSDYKLKKVVPYNYNTSSFVFELPLNLPSLFPVASCLVARSSDPEELTDNKGRPIIRPYTPVSSPNRPGEIELLVKKYDTGVMSKYIHNLKPGQTIALKGPIVKYPLKENEFEEVALIGGGTGITPLYQILEFAFDLNKGNTTKFTLIYSNVTEADILMRERLEELQKQNPEHLKIVYALDKPPASWKGLTGYVTKDVVTKYVAPSTLGDKVKVFVCGPPGQVASLAGKKAGMQQGELDGVFKELGYSSDQVFKF